MKSAKAQLKIEKEAAARGEPLHEDGPFDNVFEAIHAGDPEKAANLTLRSELMDAIEARVQGWGLTQVEAAKRLGIKQPRLNALLKGHIDKFSVDALVLIAKKAALTLRIEPELDAAA